LGNQNLNNIAKFLTGFLAPRKTPCLPAIKQGQQQCQQQQHHRRQQQQQCEAQKSGYPAQSKVCSVWTDWTDIIAAVCVAVGVAVAVAATVAVAVGVAVNVAAAGRDCTKRSTQTTHTHRQGKQRVWYVQMCNTYKQMAMAAYGNIPRAHSKPLGSRSDSSNTKGTAATAAVESNSDHNSSSNMNFSCSNNRKLNNNQQNISQIGRKNSRNRKKHY